ncbi:hypothetical protein [Nostoc sp.]|uniref:hypothetical protein n=1 Tax=Nostoc sp. TaxID=1180 RepID=UPI002FFC630C
MREIKGLNDAISVSIVDPIISDQGWMFSEAPGAIPDWVNHTQYLQEIYQFAANYRLSKSLELSTRPISAS